MRAAYPNKVNRSGCYYRCGASGHTARSCVVETCCLSYRDTRKEITAGDLRSGSRTYPLIRNQAKSVIPIGQALVPDERSLALSPEGGKSAPVSQGIEFMKITRRGQK